MPFWVQLSSALTVMELKLSETQFLVFLTEGLGKWRPALGPADLGDKD